jgi:hypothetical protein
MPGGGELKDQNEQDMSVSVSVVFLSEHVRPAWANEKRFSTPNFNGKKLGMVGCMPAIPATAGEVK